MGCFVRFVAGGRHLRLPGFHAHSYIIHSVQIRSCTRIAHCTPARRPFVLPVSPLLGPVEWTIPLPPKILHVEECVHHRSIRTDDVPIFGIPVLHARHTGCKPPRIRTT